MAHHKQPQRILAMAMSIVMMLGMTPITAFAETPPIGTSGEIIAFEALSEETANREVPLGTSPEDLKLPDTLNATVRVATPTDAEKPEQDSGELQFEEKGISVPLTWASDPDYDSDTAGTYTFTAKVTDDSYTVSAALPAITVTVQEEAPPTGGEITAFDPLDEDIAEQSHPIGTPLSALVLPKTLDATVSGAAVSVPVRWESDPEYGGETVGTYIFTAQVEDYILAQGVELPVITVETWANMIAARMENSTRLEVDYSSPYTTLSEAITAALDNSDLDSVTEIVITGSNSITFADCRYIVENATVGQTWDVSGITFQNNTIGYSAFSYYDDSKSGPTHDSFSRIILPNTLRTIESFAFDSCNQLTNIVIPNSVVSIGHFAFIDCIQFTNIVIPDSVETIGQQAFLGCTSLETIVIGSSVHTIGNSAFRDCSSLTSITLPSITTIEAPVFDGCTALSNITLNVVSDTTLTDVDKLNGVTLPNELTFSNITVQSGQTLTLDCDFTIAAGKSIVNDGTLVLTPGSTLTINGTFTNNGTLVLTLGSTLTINGKFINNGTFKKADGPAAPAVSGSYTGNGSTFTYTVNAIAGAEYSKDNTNWQDSNIFTGFTTVSPTTTFYARVKETDTRKAGAAGETGEVNFVKLNVSAAPALAYTISGAFPKTVTITPVSGAEYKFGDDDWSDSNVYISSEAENIALSIRLKATATHNASDESSVGVNTANQEQSAPLAFTLAYESANDTSYNVTIPTSAGAEYSFDGSTWSSSNVKTGCLPGDLITGYKRLAAKEGFNASPVTGDSITLPLFQVKTPTITPNGGTFSGSQSVTLSCATADAEIRYTTDGTIPTAGSILYTGAINLTATTTVKAIAVKSSMADSTILSVTFTRYNGGGGGSSSGGSSSSTTTPATTTPGKTPNQPATAAAPVTATAGQNSSASASIPEKSVTDAIAKAQADAKAQGKTANGTTVALNVTMPKGATSLTANLTRNSLNSLVSAGVTSLELNGSPVTVSFDTKALAEIQKQSSGNISITIVPNASLSASAKAMIGTRPVYDLTVSYTKDGKNATVSSFGGGTATVSVPYTPAKGEAIGGLYAVYVDEKGNATRIAGSAYDVNSKSVIFTTTHFSLYGIGYTAPSAKFADITTHWAKESIDYAVGRGLLSGTAETIFAPDTAMTRGMLVTALGRLANVDTKVYTTNSFTDVKADSAFRPYIEWAYKKGVVQGTGNGKFEPDRAVTREEIAVIFSNYAKTTGYTLPVTRTAATYADASGIGSTYKTAVTAMQQAGIMMGGSGNKFNPKSSATRAEVSSMLHRYIKLTIDPDTAQGWAKNDAGQYLYYKDSKALTGTQTIGGTKYFFNTDGTLKTGWVKDDAGNWRFYSGNIILVGFWDLGANGSNKTYYFNKDGIMVAGKWLEIDGKWYYFNADGSLAKSTKIDEYEVDENGVRKTK